MRKKIERQSNILSKLTKTASDVEKPVMESDLQELHHLTDVNFDRQVKSELVNQLQAILDETQLKDEGGAMRLLLNPKLTKLREDAKRNQEKITKTIKGFEKYESRLINQEIEAKLKEEGCNKLHASVVAQHMLDRALVKPVINDQGEVVFSLEYFDLEVKNMKLDPPWAILFNDNQDGDPGSTPDNPFKREALNLTKQGELTRSNPELAKRLKAEAVKAYEPRKKASEGHDNPWKADTFNVTEQGRIFKENPVRAKQLATEAGKKLYSA